MQQPEIKSYESASALLGDLHPLLDQLGSAEGLISLAEAVGLLRVPEVRNLETLLTFLTAYKRELLLTVELPCIQKAYDHACGNQTRELIALDRAVDKLDQRVDDALVMDEHVDAFERQAKEPVRLDDFKALVHQRGGVDGDLGAHGPRRMAQRLGRCDRGEGLGRTVTEGAARSGQLQPPHTF